MPRSTAETTKSAKQIGAELGVPWLLEGVVRWAKDAGGVWRAQVTPTLVDARAGTTRWTGAPVVITPDDPFTAQGDIATRVADALAVELQPNDRAALARRMTNNPEAFAAWVRGVAALDAAAYATSTDGMKRAAARIRERRRTRFHVRGGVGRARGGLLTPGHPDDRRP